MPIIWLAPPLKWFRLAIGLASLTTVFTQSSGSMPKQLHEQAFSHSFPFLMRLAIDWASAGSIVLQHSVALT